MLESLKELEKDVEKFHEQVLASNELIYLLRRVIGQAETLNDSFDKASGELLENLGTLPDTIEEKNREHGEAVHEDLTGALAAAVVSFKSTQDEYIDTVKGAQDGLAETMNGARDGLTETMKGAQDGITETMRGAQDGLTETMKGAQDGLNETVSEVKEGILASMESTKAALLETLTAAREELNGAKEAVKEESEVFIQKSSELPGILDEKNAACAERIEDSVNKSISTAVEAFGEEQERFLETVEKKQRELDEVSKALNEKYETLLSRVSDVTNSEIPGIKEEFRRKLNTQTIILVIMMILTIVASLNRFYIP